jgi:hypothetical protein
MKELAGYLSCGNMGASQALAFAANDPATTGTKPIMINGHTQLCIAEADADWSETTASTLVDGNARGIVMANGYSQWLICFARSTGLLRIDTAGTFIGIPVYGHRLLCLSLMLVEPLLLEPQTSVLSQQFTNCLVLCCLTVQFCKLTNL